MQLHFQNHDSLYVFVFTLLNFRWINICSLIRFSLSYLTLCKITFLEVTIRGLWLISLLYNKCLILKVIFNCRINNVNSLSYPLISKWDRSTFQQIRRFSKLLHMFWFHNFLQTSLKVFSMLYFCFSWFIPFSL